MAAMNWIAAAPRAAKKRQAELRYRFVVLTGRYFRHQSSRRNIRGLPLPRSSSHGGGVLARRKVGVALAAPRRFDHRSEP